MEAEATYTAARPVVTVPAWRASAERLDYVARATRLYEQEPGEALASARLGLYVRRWIAWAGAGIGGNDEKEDLRLLSGFAIV